MQTELEIMDELMGAAAQTKNFGKPLDFSCNNYYNFCVTKSEVII